MSCIYVPIIKIIDPTFTKELSIKHNFFLNREFTKNCSGLGTVLCRHQGGVSYHFLSFISISIKLSSDSLWTVCDQYAKTDGSTFDKFKIVGGKMKSGCPKNAENQRSQQIPYSNDCEFVKTQLNSTKSGKAHMKTLLIAAFDGYRDHSHDSDLINIMGTICP